ncbi:MAG TPA: PAS domain-containing protein, partial [Luteolibacter sp.]
MNNSIPSSSDAEPGKAVPDACGAAGCEQAGLEGDELSRVSERLQVAVRAAGIGIWDWDIVKNELVWDDSMYRLYGIRREDFNGDYEAWSRSLHPEDKDRAMGAIEAALRGESEYSVEFRIIWPDDTVRFIRGDSQTFRDEQGKPLRMVGVNYDVTESRLVQEELRLHRHHLEELVAARTEEFLKANTALEATVKELGLFRYMMDKATTAIYLIARDGRFVYVNECAAQFSGYTREELLGMSVGDLNTELTPEGWNERWNA